LSLVQRASRRRVHGRRRLARAGRSHWHGGGDHQTGNPAVFYRRGFRDRSALGDFPGGVVQTHGKAHFPHGAHPPSLRAHRVERIENHRAVLDRLAGVRPVRAHHIETAMKPAVELRGKRVLVVGLARTGVATALFCAARGARVTATDSLAAGGLAEAAAKLGAAGVALELGGHRRETFLAAELIVPSPGVPFDQADLLAARRNGVAVWSEIELAWRFLRGRLLAITGSNGKTTTTALTGHILKTA